MREIPDFDTEISVVTEYIINSDLAKKSFEEPAFANYVNLLTDLIKEIKLLADNCHMAEFTNHALPHICSIVKRVSEWGNNNLWLKEISSKEAGYLLLALLVHDIGMLSQDPVHLPPEFKATYSKGLSDTSNWVRSTHVKRLPLLLEFILEKYLPNNKDNINLVINIAITHELWPNDNYFKGDFHDGISKDRIEGLCAILAVADLLDEDATRCDSKTLLEHKHGSILNKSHWLRHSLTKRVNPVKDNKIYIEFQTLPKTSDDFNIVFTALNEHYNLINKYKDKLSNLNIVIENINFNIDSPVENKDNCPNIDKIHNLEINTSLENYDDTFEFKYDLTNCILDTFMSEIKSTFKNYDKSYLLSIEERLYKKMSDSELLDEWFNYMKKKTEDAYLSGDIGEMLRLSWLALEKTTKGACLNNVYWIFIYGLKFLKSASELYYLKNKFDSLTAESDNTNLILLNILFTTLSITVPTKESKFEILLDIEYKNFEINSTDVIPYHIMFEFILELIFINYPTTNKWEKISKHIYENIANNSNNNLLKPMLKETRIRLDLHNSIFYNKEIDAYIGDDIITYYFSKCWSHYFNSNWDKLKEIKEQLETKVNESHEYYVSVLDFDIMSKNNIKSHVKPFSLISQNISDDYNYQKNELKTPLRIFNKLRVFYLKKLISEIKLNPNKTGAKRAEALMLTEQLELSALKCWDLRLYISCKKYMLEIYKSMAIYYDKYDKYAGLPDCVKETIFYSIKFTFKMEIEHNEMEILSEILRTEAKSDINEVFDFIFNNRPNMEWFNCSIWLEYLIRFIPENYMDKLICWSICFLEYVKVSPYKNNSEMYNFLITLFDNHTLTSEQWSKLKPIKNEILNGIKNAKPLNIELYQSLLKKMLENELIVFLDEFKLLNGKKFTNIDTITLLGTISNQHPDLTPTVCEILTKFYKENNDQTYKDFAHLIKYENITANLEENIPDLIKSFDNILNIIKESDKCKIPEIDESDLLKVGTGNWSLASTEEIENLFSTFKNILIDKRNQLHLNHFLHIFNIVSIIILRQNKIEKNCITKLVIFLIDTDYKVAKHSILDIPEHPMSNFHTNSNVPDFLNDTYLDVFINTIQYGTTLNKEFIIDWCIKQIPICKYNFIHKIFILYSYLYIYETDILRQKAYEASLMVKVVTKTPKYIRERRFNGLLENINDLIANSYKFSEDYLDVISKEENQHYLKLILEILEDSSQSFDFNCNTEKNRIITLLKNNKNIANNINFINYLKK